MAVPASAQRAERPSPHFNRPDSSPPRAPIADTATREAQGLHSRASRLRPAPPQFSHLSNGSKSPGEIYQSLKKKKNNLDFFFFFWNPRVPSGCGRPETAMCYPQVYSAQDAQCLSEVWLQGQNSVRLVGVPGEDPSPAIPWEVAPPHPPSRPQACEIQARTV